jgi:hypothetical protein
MLGAFSAVPGFRSRCFFAQRRRMVNSWILSIASRTRSMHRVQFRNRADSSCFLCGTLVLLKRAQQRRGKVPGIVTPVHVYGHPIATRRNSSRSMKRQHQGAVGAIDLQNDGCGIAVGILTRSHALAERQPRVRILRFLHEEASKKTFPSKYHLNDMQSRLPPL